MTGFLFLFAIGEIKIINNQIKIILFCVPNKNDECETGACAGFQNILKTWSSLTFAESCYLTMLCTWREKVVLFLSNVYEMYNKCILLIQYTAYLE